MLNELQRFARRLPVEAVTTIEHVTRDRCDSDRLDPDDRLWGIVAGARAVATSASLADIQGRQVDADRLRAALVAPSELDVLQVRPGARCEDALFGFARYPVPVHRFVPLEGPPPLPPVAVGEWHWSNRCKTQYAGTVSTEHFLRCHVSVCLLLELARELDCLDDVQDDGAFWETRDVDVLLEELAQNNAVAAALELVLSGQKGLTPVGDAPITAHPDWGAIPGAGEIARQLGHLPDLLRALTGTKDGATGDEPPG